MAGRLLVVGEVADGGLTRLSTEVATLARSLSEASGLTVHGVVTAPDPSGPAAELARFTGGEVSAVSNPGATNGPAAAVSVHDGLAFGQQADYILLGASPDGRDTAGMMSALLGRGVLANATAVAWEGGAPVVEMSVFGGKLITRSTFTKGQGIITVRPNAVTAEPAAKPGTVTEAAPKRGPDLAEVRVVDRVAEAGAAAPIEEARIIVAGGRGIGGAEGFELVQQVADQLGGAVGATRAAVDAGWINYNQQIGQTGKIVKPQLYLALGISGAIQHKVGMQTAETIVAVNRDPDAPIAEFADLMVVGDLFEIVPALLDELRSRSG
jgi:electron transfer flavoprotein alpha subunit